jgi:HK97 family phage prohead protease
MTELKSFALELKTMDESGTFEGRLAVYNNIDAGGDIIERGAFRKTIAEGASQIPLLWQHDSAMPLGTLQLSDSPSALLARGRLVLSVPKAREARDLLRAGAVRGMSIGYKTLKADYDGKGNRHLKELKLFEGSLVTMPMNSEALVTSVKTAVSGESKLVRMVDEMRKLLIWPEAPLARASVKWPEAPDARRALNIIDDIRRSLKR